MNRLDVPNIWGIFGVASVVGFAICLLSWFGLFLPWSMYIGPAAVPAFFALKAVGSSRRNSPLAGTVTWIAIAAVAYLVLSIHPPVGVWLAK
jgi:hypothetical protein